MAYDVRGTYLESCSCEVACPCGASNLALPATYDRCRVLLAFHFDQGTVDGVDVAGTTTAMFADTPAQMTDGNWRVGLFLDESATDEQRAKLAALFGGELGGPAGMFAPLVGEMLGAEVVAMDYSDDGRTHTFRIGDDIDIEVEDFAGVEEGSTMHLGPVGHPAGPTLTLSHGVRAKINAFGLDIDNTGRNAHSAPIAWTA